MPENGKRIVPAQEAIGRVTTIMKRCLEEGLGVEIEGLGLFRLREDGEVEFVAETRPKVFIAYSDHNREEAEKLCVELEAAGFDTWLDKKRLLPGQNWPRSIERAIEVSDFFVACFSSRGIGRRGFFQAELRFALDCARRQPLGSIFFIPVRLDDCAVPARISRELQYVDLFPDWGAGVASIIAAIRGNTQETSPRAADVGEEAA